MQKKDGGSTTRSAKTTDSRSKNGIHSIEGIDDSEFAWLGLDPIIERALQEDRDEEKDHKPVKEK